jgi:hypothetical protein
MAEFGNATFLATQLRPYAKQAAININAGSRTSLGACHVTLVRVAQPCPTRRCPVIGDDNVA